MPLASQPQGCLYSKVQAEALHWGHVVSLRRHCKGFLSLVLDTPGIPQGSWGQSYHGDAYRVRVPCKLIALVGGRVWGRPGSYIPFPHASLLFLLF